MKSTAQKYLLSIKKILPGWSGADIGHTAARDWYAALLLSTALGIGLAAFGAFHFLETSRIITAPPESSPNLSFPTDEASILEAKNRFDARAAEFKYFSTQVPTAPDPGQEKESVETVEETAPASTDVVE